MLDLDSLAEKRAQSLKEEKASWHQAVWSPGFQKISASMTDGEVVILLSSCESYAQLNSVVTYLSAHGGLSSSTPFAILNREAESAKLPLKEWIAALPRSGA